MLVNESLPCLAMLSPVALTTRCIAGCHKAAAPQAAVPRAAWHCCCCCEATARGRAIFNKIYFNLKMRCNLHSYCPAMQLSARSDRCIWKKRTWVSWLSKSSNRLAIVKLPVSIKKSFLKNLQRASSEKRVHLWFLSFTCHGFGIIKNLNI